MNTSFLEMLVNHATKTTTTTTKEQLKFILETKNRKIVFEIKV